MLTRFIKFQLVLFTILTIIALVVLGWYYLRLPSLVGVGQYKLVDDAPLPSFQSGLRFADGRPKPGYAAYQLPIWVSRRGARLRVYGQVRPAANRTPQTVQIQVRPPKGGGFTTVKTVTVRSRRGQFLTRVPKRAGVWRLVSGSLVSREARVAAR